MSDDNIIDFPMENPRAELQEGLSYKKKEKYCRCVAVEVSEYDRTVECRNCGASIDPFDWCVTMCKEWQFLADKKKMLKQQANNEVKKLKDIKRQIVNAKAQLKRAKVAPSEIVKPKITEKGINSLQQIIKGLGE